MLIQGGGNMRYNITELDKSLLLQPFVDYKYKLLVVKDNKNVLGEIEGIQSIGAYSINSQSSIRRTTSMVLYLEDMYRNLNIEERLCHWIGYNFELQIGIYNIRDNDYVWYKCGYYLITDANTSYDATNNSLSTTLSDWYSKFDGTRNGQIGGAPVIYIPNKDENGNYFTIQSVVTDVLLNETGIKDYIIEDVGEFNGMPENNPDWETYRNENPLWNKLPYDLEYDSGCYVSDILEEIVSLYPNCQMYFDIYGFFCHNMIPSCNDSPIIMNNDYIQQILVAENSENVTYSIKDIKNVTEVFGATYEIDRYATKTEHSDSTYTLTVDNYVDNYNSNDLIAFDSIAENGSNNYIKINNLASIPLYHEYTTDFVEAGTLVAGETYVIKIKKVKVNDKDEYGYVAYYLGQYQPHAVCVLTSKENDEVYTKKYFADKYNCNIKNVVLRVEEDSPFTVQKIGEVLDSKSGGEFENILSDKVAKENAIYYNRQSSSINDTVTITTKMMPFLDTNVKVEYQKLQDDESHEYIIKEITNNTDNNTSTIVMYRFYPLYY